MASPDSRRRSLQGSSASRTAGLLLLLTPVIWGATFPAAKLALDDLSPWTFTAWSRVLGLAAAAVMVAVVRPSPRAWTIGLIPAGLLLGTLMFLGFSLQTVGLQSTTATNAGFITVLYVVWAPLGAAALARRPPERLVLVCVPLSLVGLGLLSLDGWSLHSGDALVLACSLALAGHIVAVSLLVERFDALALAAAQLAGTTVIHLVAAIPDGVQAGDAAGVWHLLVITGVLGSGVVFTLQVI